MNKPFTFLRRSQNNLVNPENRHINLIEAISLANNSRKAWKTIRKLNSIKQTERKTAVTPMKIARQLIGNGVPSRLKKAQEEVRKKLEKPNKPQKEFTMTELDACIMKLKNGKATGTANILNKMIQHLNIKSKYWILDFMNNCTRSNIPKERRKAKVIVLQKTNKQLQDERLPTNLTVEQCFQNLRAFYSEHASHGLRTKNFPKSRQLPERP